MALLLRVALLVAAVWAPLAYCGRPTLRLDVHHRFSDAVRLREPSLPGGWPESGTAEYYAALAAHDRGRHLASQELTFADGNETLQLGSLGSLHYAVVAVGTPNVTFLVALDTGSHLFWLPCDCRQCAPTSSPSYGLNVEFDIYSPNKSSSSRSVTCNNSLCELESECSAATSHCPYQVAYATADTSSSGILVEDVLYLTTEDSHPEVIKAPITFGCGIVQTGAFLETAAPNGLFGLGMDKISVPSLLASAGLTSDSFSMCFGRDGIGRIRFGDKGSSDQDETPFHVNKSQPTYNISIAGITVGNIVINTSFSVFVDSGSSFTSLADPAYTRLSEIFNAQAQDERRAPDPNIPFENCYNISPNKTKIEIPDINFTTESGSQFPVTNPVVLIYNERQEYAYCLAVVKSHRFNIIAQNFMTGLRIVFDREKLVLGWKKFNCYEVEDSIPLPINPRNSSAFPPMVTVGPSSYSPEATREAGNKTNITPIPSYSPHPNLFPSYAFVLLLVPLALL